MLSVKYHRIGLLIDGAKNCVAFDKNGKQHQKKRGNEKIETL